LERAMLDPLNTITLFSVPPPVDRTFMRDLSALPVPIIREAVTLIAVADDYNSFIQSSMPHARTMDGMDRGDYIDDMRRRVEGMRKGSTYLKAHLEGLIHSGAEWCRPN
jgi:hypothetical protein